MVLKISVSTCCSPGWKNPGCQNQAKWLVVFVRWRFLTAAYSAFASLEPNAAARLAGTGYR
jgi:hypothetical protein